MPTGPRNPRKPDGPLAGLVRAESMLQIAILLPAAVVVGWLLGTWGDHMLHTTWLNIAGILLGAVAGFIQVFQLISKAAK